MVKQRLLRKLVCICKANASQGTQGEPDSDEVPVALRPGPQAEQGLRSAAGT